MDKNTPLGIAQFYDAQTDSTELSWAYLESADIEYFEIEYFDEDFNKKTEVYNGLIARVIQHEYDHIEGILFTDHVSSLKKKLISKKLKNISNFLISF